MAEGKKSFVLYADLIHTLNQTPDDLAGKLFKLILQYVNDENPEPKDLVLKLLFEPIKQQLKRDLRKYEDRKAMRSEAGKRGAEARWGNTKNGKAMRPHTTASDAMAKMAVNDNDSVSVNDNVIINIGDFCERFVDDDGYLNSFTQPPPQYIKSLLTKKSDYAPYARHCIQKGDEVRTVKEHKSHLLFWARRKWTDLDITKKKEYA